MMIFIIWTYTGQENKIVQQTCLNITVHTLYRTLPHLRWKWRQCTGENSVELTKDFKLTISFQKRILAGYWLNFTFLAAVFRPVLDHPLLLCFSTPILVLHHFSSLALVALFDTNVFLLNEYFISTARCSRWSNDLGYIHPILSGHPEIALTVPNRL